jgi:WD40 repeat protein
MNPRSVAVAAGVLVVLVLPAACYGQAPRAVLRTTGGAVYSVAFSPDDRMLAAACEDGRIELWEVATGGRRAMLRGHTKAVTAVTFTQDGTALESSSEDGTKRVWGLTKGRPKAVHRGQTDWPPGMAFSGSHRLVALSVGFGSAWVRSGRTRKKVSLPKGGSLGAVWLVDLDTGANAQLQGHEGFVLSLEFSGDDRLLASGSSDGTVRLWDVRALLKQGAPGP